MTHVWQDLAHFFGFFITTVIFLLSPPREDVLSFSWVCFRTP